MKKDFSKSIGIFVITAFVLFFLDRFLKEFALEYFHTPVVLIEGFFKLVQSRNAGVAFGVMLPFIVQLILVPVLLIGGFYYAIKNFRIESTFVLIVCGVITGGAISNYADRLIHGHVIDYISIWIWPVFNLADVAITLGIFTIVVFYGKISRVKK